MRSPKVDAVAITLDDEERPWAVRAECSSEDVDPGLFFPTANDDTSEALAICKRCEVCKECLDFAIEANEPYGIWGGVTERQRRRMKERERQAKRQAKVANASP